MRKKSKYHKYKQGVYKPINEEKSLNKDKPIEYRSSLELKFCRLCDKNPNIIRWGSEVVAIPYKKPPDNRDARYYPDFIVEMANGDVFMIEVKPEKQTKKPVHSNRKKPKTILTENKFWAINQAKWRAAKEFCEKRGVTFRIITENDIEKMLTK